MPDEKTIEARYVLVRADVCDGASDAGYIDPTIDVFENPDSAYGAMVKDFLSTLGYGSIDELSDAYPEADFEYDKNGRADFYDEDSGISLSGDMAVIPLDIIDDATTWTIFDLADYIKKKEDGGDGD